jgi:CBS domain-containing protein
MTGSPLCLEVETQLPKAYAQIVGRGFSGAPVVAPDGKLVGVVSAHDLLASSASAVFMGDASAEDLSAKTVAEVVGGMPLTCSGEMPLGEACRLMVRHRAHRMVVVDDETKQPKGILSAIDIVRAVACVDELAEDSASRFASVLANLSEDLGD